MLTELLAPHFVAGPAQSQAFFLPIFWSNDVW
jgi:hypothetical protein